jgi:hypothetical protein
MYADEFRARNTDTAMRSADTAATPVATSSMALRIDAEDLAIGSTLAWFPVQTTLRIS